MTPVGYDIHYTPRTGKRGGGGAIISESRLKARIHTKTAEHNSFECISTVIEMKSGPMLVTSLYRSPNNSPSMC